MFKKKCELLLIDSSSSGRIISCLSNWDGACIKAPKARLSDSASLQDVQNTGIYFLVNDDPDEPTVYIGEAENLYTRIMQHLGEDTWQEAYIITRKGNTLNKAHAKYLENHFYQKAIESGRYKVLNKTTPTKSSLSDFDISDMEEFIHYATLLVDLLGCKAFIAINEKHSSLDDLYIDSVGLKAHAKMLDDEFVVLKGSQSRADFKAASSSNLRKKWTQLREKGIIVNNKFVSNYSFSSPSMAASVVLGRNANGLTEWKNSKRITLKELLEKSNIVS